ncbi:hypothetical protein [Paraburkholderia sp. DHOC27]|uniref:hypothetical protein n=1 Tax=Paraburkholderia sp. DHOC27 TaxID=2303330 RepID=UPI000E3BD649|nr:hypothetical protein [Paraburkholderia sp. DHOC27]RFU45970.1 hypothetical protein D0B32_20125 [Paraburkholderia sp. DHOC27]
MTSQTAPLLPAESLDALPNPRGGAVRPAELALAEAQLAFEQRGDLASPLLQAVRALREAGWPSAQRFADMLVLASPLTVADPADEPNARALFAPALHDFRAAIGRHNLRELSCSPTLFAHYHALSALIAKRTPGFTVTFEDLALLARPVPPVTFSPQPAERLAHLRARYERALLPVLRAHSSDGAASAAASAAMRAALDELDACLAELAGPDPYDFWRLASACARALRVSGHLAGDADARRFHARCNLAFADHARGMPLASRSLVRSTLALLWRDYALFGAAAEDADHVEVLHDYGLTVDWHVAGTQDSEVLWEAGAASAQASQTQRGAADSLAVRTRELGVLTVNAHAYEDFLQTADASIAALAEHARAAGHPEKADPGEALQASDAAFRLGAAACALGLGHVGLLADALGLAWRRRAHAGVSTPAVRAHVIVEPPNARSLEQGAEALRAMLHTIAAGVAPPDGSLALTTLTRAIEQGVA